MSTTYRGSLDRLVLVSLLVLTLGGAFPAAAQTTAPVVAIDPPRVEVAPQATFSVTLTIAGAPQVRSYETTLAYDPAVVAVQEVAQGSFLEARSPVPLGPDIDNEAGTATFGSLGMGGAPWPSGSGQLAIVTLRAVGEGATALDLQDVDVFDPDLARISIEVEGGEVAVGEGTMPTPTPTLEGIPTATETPTGGATETATAPLGATATETATMPPTSEATTSAEATATKTATRPTPGGATTSVEAAATTSAPASPTGAAATGSPTEEGVPAGRATSTAQLGQTPPLEEPPSATSQPAEGGGEDIEPTVTSVDEAPGGETPPGVGLWLPLVAAVLGLAGVALIGVGVFAYGIERRDGREPMDDDTT